MTKETTRFPFISLRKAIERAKALYSADPRGNTMLIPTAFEAWGYSPKSSGGHQTVAALLMYGLLIDEGAKEARRVGLSESCLNFFRDERDSEKQKYIREFALNPPLLKALWQDWGSSPPADPIARSHLKLDRGLNEQSARSLLSIYKENVRFSELEDNLTAHADFEDEGNDQESVLDQQDENRISTENLRGRHDARKVLKDEREVPGFEEKSSGILSKQTEYRLLVRGPLGSSELQRLIKKIEIDIDILLDGEE